MKKALKFAAVATSCLLAVSVFAACGGKEETADSAYEGARICFDNLDDEITLPASDTTYKVEGATDLKAYAFDGTPISDPSTVATYADGVFTAKGVGIVTYTRGSKQGRVEVVPAYVTDPGNQYTGNTQKDTDEAMGEKYLGHTHDPSFIEVMENGKPVYYLFSTGWNETPDVTIEGLKYSTYGNAIHRSEDLLTWKFMGRTFELHDREEEFIGSDAWAWLYGGQLGGSYTEDSASWWAPDIVPAPDGGYWLYTCVVDGAGGSEGMYINGQKYARACILLYHSKSLEAGSFTAVKGPDGKQAVLIQSSIQRNETVADVNGIDPQIIYTPDGKMYMAYGSFGSGDYIIELDPQTGLRKDGKGWQTHEEIRQYVADIQSDFGSASSDSIGWEHEYYGKNISKANMEAPVLARHDNVKIFDETATFDENGEPTGADGKAVEGKTYYYTMHSYDGLGDNYQMYGGRSDSPLGIFKSAGGEGIVRNVSPGNEANSGNKYMGAFTWHNKTNSKEIDIILPGHNDLYTTYAGVSLAAYITRSPSYGRRGSDGAYSGNFVTQIHQYYLNSKGDICINPNRYSGEMMRTVTKEELLKYTDNGKFKMVYMNNHRDTNSDFEGVNISVDVTLGADGKIKSGTTDIGTWQMYGKCYIKIEFTEAQANGEKVYYGVVSPAWLGDQNKSGFTITALGYTNPKRSMSIFFNNYSTITGSNLVG